MIKVVAPNMACQVIDWAIQAHGGGGVCDDFPLAYAYACARTLRFADGPDEVHRNAIAKLELARHHGSGRVETSVSSSIIGAGMPPQLAGRWRTASERSAIHALISAMHWRRPLRAPVTHGGAAR